MSMKDTVLAFIERINAHDVDGILGLMADNYKFVNSSGDVFQGRDIMREIWNEHFHQYPDFKIKVLRVIADRHGVAVFAVSQGTYSPNGHMEEENHWEVPAAFLGIARSARMTHWQVYSDTSWVFDIIEANEKSSS